MAAYAALVSLMNNIEQIQRHTRLPISFDQKQSQSLLEKVIFLIDFLESYDYLYGAGEEIKNLESRIRDTAYAAEDIIETHVVDKIHAHSRSSREENEMMIVKNPTLSSLEKVVEDLDSIKDAAIKLKDSNETKVNPIIEPSIRYVPVEMISTVGFDDELERITDRLLAHEPSRQFIPIVGMGGIGKTTLAKTVYEKYKHGMHFDFCAWVTISQKYDFKNIMSGLLSISSSQLSEDELGQRLHQKLCGRRYLIVLDDMWSVDPWEMVMRFLPDDNNRNRIIVTTRESSVSTCFGSSSHEISFLDEDQSWSLFCEKVFASNGCPFELEEVGRNIVKNCKGLPLSIVVIGGFLAKSDMRKEYWEYIVQDTKTIINSADDEQCMKILSLSYQNLPVRLKPCFLYLGTFPEDDKIKASMLIKLWVAEGFLKSNCSKTLEVLGREYLNELISRNLIMVDRRGYNGKIKSCMIHDLLRDICVIEAQNDKFMYTIKLCSRDEEQYIGSQRRVSLHESTSNAESIPPVHNTLRSRSMIRTLIRVNEHIALQLQNHRLMRVFNTRADLSSLNEIFQLVNSRFIVMETNPDTIIPSSICLLWNLQILIVKGIEGRHTAPLEIWEMTELRHLQFDWDTYLPEPAPSLKINTKQCDTTMKNLHTLKGILDFRLSDEVVKRIPNIKNLEIGYEEELNRKELEDMSLTNLGRLQNLESLLLALPLLPSCDVPSHLTFPNSLKKLLYIGGIQREDMSTITSLPHLQVLKLSVSFTGPKWVLDEEIFPCLKYFHISCDDLVEWIAEETHFPCLEYLELFHLDKLEEIPLGIGDIPTLKKIELEDCSKSAVISAKKILDEQEKLGNVSLQVMVTCDKDAVAELETLASDNFQVCANDESTTEWTTD